MSEDLLKDRLCDRLFLSECHEINAFAYKQKHNDLPQMPLTQVLVEFCQKLTPADLSMLRRAFTLDDVQGSLIYWQLLFKVQGFLIKENQEPNNTAESTEDSVQTEQNLSFNAQDPLPLALAIFCQVLSCLKVSELSYRGVDLQQDLNSQKLTTKQEVALEDISEDFEQADNNTSQLPKIPKPFLTVLGALKRHDDFAIANLRFEGLIEAPSTEIVLATLQGLLGFIKEPQKITVLSLFYVSLHCLRLHHPKISPFSHAEHIKFEMAQRFYLFRN